MAVDPWLRRRAQILAAKGGGGGIPTAPTSSSGGGTGGGSSSSGGSSGGTTPSTGGYSSGSSSSSSSSSGGKPKPKPDQSPGWHAGPGTSGYKPGQDGKDGKDGKDGGGERAKASRRYMEQAKTLQLQIDATLKALGPHGGKFKKALKVHLRNVRGDFNVAEDTLMEGYKARHSELDRAAEDNAKSEAQLSFSNLSNAGRERANAISQAALQGAGESDLLASQSMSLRNWEQNQNDISRNAFDTQTSIAGSLTDLTQDTKGARIQNARDANDAREELWNGYYDQREQAQISLGNLYGQQAELYGFANEAKASKAARRKLKRAQRKSGNAFDNAADLTGKAWKDPGVDDTLTDWGGLTLAPRIGASHAPVEVVNLGAPERKKPEGASLRKWGT